MAAKNGNGLKLLTKNKINTLRINAKNRLYLCNEASELQRTFT